MQYLVLIDSKKKQEDLKAALEKVKGELEASTIVIRGVAVG